MVVIDLNQGEIFVERVKKGEVFRYGEELFMATNQHTEYTRFCVNIKTGDLFRITKNTPVTLIEDVKITIN